MKVFVSYAFTGEDHAVLQERLSGLRDVFNELGLDFYINIFAADWQAMMDRNATSAEFLKDALRDMKTSDVALIIQSSERRSEGMLIEIGAAFAMGKKIVLAQHVSCVGKTYLPTIANHTFLWNDNAELLELSKDYFNGTT